MPFRSVVGFPVLVAFFALATAWFVWLAVRPDRRGALAGRSEPNGALGLSSEPNGALAARPEPKGGVAHRGHFVGHAVMFGAMTWHLAGMVVRMQAMAPAGAGPMTGQGHAMVPGGAMAAASASTSAAMVVAWVGLPFMAALLLMGLRDVVATVAPAGPSSHQHGHAPALVSSHAHAGHLPAPAAGGGQAGPEAAGGQSGHTISGGQAGPTTAGGLPGPHADLADGLGSRATTSMMASMNLGMFWMSVGLVTPLVPVLAILQV